MKTITKFFIENCFIIAVIPWPVFMLPFVLVAEGQLKIYLLGIQISLLIIQIIVAMIFFKR